MPELPEVETTVRAISKFKNKTLKEIIVHNKNLRWKVVDKVELANKNKKIKEIERRAKYILIHFDDSSLMIHLGMSGKLRIQKIKNNFFMKHDHAELIFSKEKIIFNDPRRFGSIHLTNDFKHHKLIKNLGVEPLSKSFNKSYLFNVCNKSNLNIKKVIMDQKKIVGVGNIYASESLFLAKIRPDKSASKISMDDCYELVKSIKKVLRYAIKMGGTTLKDFYSADGNEGYFNLELSVYGREGESCKICGAKVKKINIGQRSTFYCQNCQN